MYHKDYKNIIFIKKFFKQKLNIKNFRISLITPYDYYTYDEKINYLKLLDYEFDEFMHIISSSFDVYEISNNIYDKALKKFIFMKKYKLLARYPTCKAGTSIFFINNKGDIYPCPTLEEKNSLKIGENYEIKYKLDSLFPDVDKDSNCKNCWIKYLCGGYCFFARYFIKKKEAEEFGCKVQNKLWENTYKIIIEFYNNPNKFSKALDYYKNIHEGDY